MFHKYMCKQGCRAVYTPFTCGEGCYSPWFSFED